MIKRLPRRDLPNKITVDAIYMVWTWMEVNTGIHIKSVSANDLCSPEFISKGEVNNVTINDENVRPL